MIEAFCLFYNTLTFPMLRVEPAECIAEVSLEGYLCATAQPLGRSRWRISTTDGLLRLEKDGIKN
jgi:hypothetical protein